MRYKIIIFLIIIVASVLRFWHLGGNPASLDWDEASLGYNAYSLLKSGRDEYGNKWPIAIRSFNDYKPPLYTYLTMIPVAILGLNEFSTRFVSSLFGVLAVLVSYFLVKELFPKKSLSFYLLFLIFFALSPWHIQFSRIAFEANLALFFFLCGILFFLKGMKKNILFPVSFMMFGFSMYSYHSTRLISPLMIIGLLLIFLNKIWSKKGWIILSLLTLLLMVFPIYKSFSESTSARFGSVTVINPSERLGSSIKSIEYDQERQDILGKLMHNRRLVYAKDILAGYLDHFNFDFLFLSGDPPGRHHATGMGMLYIWDLPFVLLGLYLLINLEQNNLVLLLWFLIAPLASALTSGTPHAVRALLYLPIYQIFTGFGYFKFIKIIKVKIIKRYKLIILLTFLFFVLNFYYYLHMYWVHTPYEYASEWQYGYKQMVIEVAKLKKESDKVIVTYAYDQPYIYFLFYDRVNPAWYQKSWGEGEINRSERKFGDYEFRSINYPQDSQLINTILVGTAGEIPENARGLLKEIKFPDGQIAFRIVRQ